MMAAICDSRADAPCVTPAGGESIVSSEYMHIAVLSYLVSKSSLTDAEKNLLRCLLIPRYFQEQTEALKRQIIETRAKEYLLQSVVELSQLINEARRSDKGWTSAKLQGLRRVFLGEDSSKEDEPEGVLTEREIIQGRNCRGIFQWHFEQATFLDDVERGRLISAYELCYRNVMTGIFDSLASHVNSTPERRPASLGGNFSHSSSIRLRKNAEFTLEFVNHDNEELVVHLHELGEIHELTPLRKFNEEYRQDLLSGTSEELEIDFQPVVKCADESQNRQALEILLEDEVGLNDTLKEQVRQVLIKMNIVGGGAVIRRADGSAKTSGVRRNLFPEEGKTQYIIYGTSLTVLTTAAIVDGLATHLRHTLQEKINQLWPAHHTTLMGIEYAVAAIAGAAFLCCIGLLFREIISDCHQKEKNKKAYKDSSPRGSVSNV